MSELSGVVGAAFASEYRNRATEVHTRVDALREEQFWHTPFSYGNIVGDLQAGQIIYLRRELRKT